jgi:glyoxylase-like metal-dependent hydrolase (beta-lactamase superfamily II)
MTGVRLIDTMMADLTGLTAAFLVPARRPALVETGPGRSAGHVLAALRAAGLGPDDLAHIVLTHVHLDHAGAAGVLAGAFPSATVLVHPAGVRHLVDPTRLLASAARVHGPLMDTVYGSMTPVPADRVVAVEDGARVDLGDRRLLVRHTPGHAAHHLSVLDEGAGVLFPGDSAGVRVRPMRRARPATPPPDFDADAAVDSLRRMRAMAADRLLLTHFGEVDDPDGWLAAAERDLRRWCEVARGSAQRADPAGLEAELLAAFAAEEGLAEADPTRFAVFGGFAPNAAGLSRWAGGPAGAAPGG